MGNILRWATRPFILIAMFATRARALYKVSKAFFHFTICMDTQLYLNIFSIGFLHIMIKPLSLFQAKDARCTKGGCMTYSALHRYVRYHDVTHVKKLSKGTSSL